MNNKNKTEGISERIPPKTVDEYLALLPGDQRTALDKLRKIIKKAAPQAEEVISYQIPGYKYHGMLVFFAAFKNHLSFYPGRRISEEFKKDFKDFQVVGTTVHFTPEHSLPASLVRKIVKTRMKENETRGK